MHLWYPLRRHSPAIAHPPRLNACLPIIDFSWDQNIVPTSRNSSQFCRTNRYCRLPCLSTPRHVRYTTYSIASQLNTRPSTFISSNIPEAFILITQPECPFLLYRAITTLFDVSSYRAVNNLLVCHQILHCSGFGLEVSVLVPAYLSITFRCFFSSQSG